jgi:hypothetical protein
MEKQSEIEAVTSVTSVGHRYCCLLSRTDEKICVNISGTAILALGFLLDHHLLEKFNSKSVLVVECCSSFNSRVTLYDHVHSEALKNWTPEPAATIVTIQSQG